MKPITLPESVISTKTLSELLEIQPDDLLKELKEEKGIFADELNIDTPLTANTILRAGERHGFNITSPKPTPRMELNPQEIQTLQKCSQFHKGYGEYLVEKSHQLETDAAKELAGLHFEFSGAIDFILDKALNHDKNKEAKRDRAGMISPGFV
jgi:hypothetical protein